MSIIYTCLQVFILKCLIQFFLKLFLPVFGNVLINDIAKRNQEPCRDGKPCHEFIKFMVGQKQFPL